MTLRFSGPLTAVGTKPMTGQSADSREHDDEGMSWDTNAVTTFAREQGDIFILPRPAPCCLGEVIPTARVHEYWAIVNRDSVARELRFGMHELRLRSSELAADIARLATSFLTQFNLQQAKLRVEVTQSQSCPNFHCDNEHVRLVTTYHGPATQYRFDADDTIHAAPLHGLVFLKGRRHPTHQDAVCHRSPEVPSGVKRLCVAIDY